MASVEIKNLNNEVVGQLDLADYDAGAASMRPRCFHRGNMDVAAIARYRTATLQ